MLRNQEMSVFLRRSIATSFNLKVCSENFSSQERTKVLTTNSIVIFLNESISQITNFYIHNF